MDYTGWPQNPNPNPYAAADSTFWYTADYSANHYPNLATDPYQSAVIYSHNASFPTPLQPQPLPPVVDPQHMVPPATVVYVDQTNYEAPQSAVRGSYYPDPNANWAASASLFGSAFNAAGAIAPTGEIQPQRGNPVIQSYRRNTKKKVQKMTKVVQSAWCDVCKVDCNSVGVFDQHKLGKRHKKNLEKLKMSSTSPNPSVMAAPASTVAASDTSVAAPPAAATTSHTSMAAPPAPATTSHAIVPPLPVVEVNHPAVVATAPAPAPPAPAVGAAYTSIPACVSAATDKPIIGPKENPEKSKPLKARKSRRKAAACIEDLETKRRKVLEGGATAASVRTCNVCNVVCNSDTVFNFHLAGQKHASMVKKLASKAITASIV